MPTARVKTETLEALIRRVQTDARAVGAPVSADILANAIVTGGWRHRSGDKLWLADIIDHSPTTEPRFLALYVHDHGWRHQHAIPTNRPD